MSVGVGLGRLERVDLRDVWLSEAANFTPWLAADENIALLGDAIGIELEVEAQEKNVGPFRADILCKDTASSNWVLIENQLERTDHSHLGQLLTYASGLHAVTIVWIAERFTDEHRGALDWLNEVTREDINFFGLEIELWKIGDSAVAPKFNVVSKPNDWTRSIIIDPVELTETKKLQFDYWTEFHKCLTARGSMIRGTKPRPQHWNNFSVGRSDFGLVTFANTRDQRIGVHLVCKGEHAKPHFQQLEAQKGALEAELGPLEWRPLPDRKESQIGVRRHETDPSDKQRWPDQHEWLVQTLERFHRVFSRKLQQLESPELRMESGESEPEPGGTTAPDL